MRLIDDHTFQMTRGWIPFNHLCNIHVLVILTWLRTRNYVRDMQGYRSDRFEEMTITFFVWLMSSWTIPKTRKHASCKHAKLLQVSLVVQDMVLLIWSSKCSIKDRESFREDGRKVMVQLLIYGRKIILSDENLYSYILICTHNLIYSRLFCLYFRPEHCHFALQIRILTNIALLLASKTYIFVEFVSVEWAGRPTNSCHGAYIWLWIYFQVGQTNV